MSIASAVVATVAAFIVVRATGSPSRGPVAGSASRNPADQRATLAVQVIDGSVRRELATDLRRYAFTVAITNHAEAPRTVTAAGLRVSYRTRANFLGAVELPLTGAAAAAASNALQLPLAIAPGERVTRSAQLETSNVIPRHCRIDGYTLLLADAAGDRWTADASLPQVLRDDHDGDGPRTWGWD